MMANAAEKQNGLNTTTLISAGMLMLVVVGAFWALAFGPIQDKFATMNAHVSALEARRSELLTQVEFKQFESRVLDRLDIAQKQLLLLEQTRPSTVELGALGTNNEKQVNKLEERIRSLEIFVRPPLKSN